MTSRVERAVRRFVMSAWVFPTVLLVVVIILAALRISGSSVGMYHQALYGGTTVDQNLLYGAPQPIRSDEWLVTTPLTVSQSHADYRNVNPFVGTGTDMSVILDIPYRDWSAIFKPENLSFMVLPVEQAFAFKWWFISYLLIMSVYALVLTLLPGRRMLAILLSLSVTLAPFVQWWYQSSTLGTLTYSFFAITLFVQLMHAVGRRQKVLYGGLLTYVLTAFTLILYPPFQLPCLMGVTVVCLGYLAHVNRPWRWRRAFKLLTPVLISGAVAGALVAAFLLTRMSTVQAITNTVYPGHRVVASGNYPWFRLFDGAYDRQLQSSTRAAHYAYNQSEASNFVLLWPFLLIPSVYVAVRRWRRWGEVDYPIVLVNALLLVLTARLFLPLPEPVAKVLLLSSIPHNRLLLGVGFLSFVQLILVIRQLRQEKLSRWWAAGSALLAFGTIVAAGLTIRAQYPLYVSRRGLILAAALAVGGMVYLVLRRRPAWAAAVLLSLTFISTMHVHPLYVGLGELTNSKLVAAARQQPGAQREGWTYIGGISGINLLPAGGIQSYSATLPYPQLAFDRTLDEQGKREWVYNRYSFAMYVVDDPKVTDFTLNGEDSYFVDYEPCEAKFKRYIRHVVSQSPLSKECLRLDTTVSYPTQFYYVYSVK